MEIEQILTWLRYNTGEFPRAALEAAIQKTEEIIPALLGMFQQCVDDTEATKEDEHRMDYMFTMFLLAQFGEKRAYPLLCHFFSAL